nr:acylphosphatase [Thioalkalivibrio sp. XN279]
MVARRCIVTGLVQGVFFRASTARRAGELGVRGYACNLPDGTVEVLAVGAEDAVEALCAWLHQGPPAARVDAVSVAPVALPQPLPAGFATA